MSRAVCFALLLATILPVCLAQWTTATNGGIFSATKGKFVFEVKTIADDPIYDLGGTDLKAIFGDNEPNALTDQQKGQVTAALKKLHETSLNVILKHDGKIIFAVAEGKATEFVTPSVAGSITEEVHRELVTAVADLSPEDARVKARLLSVPKMMEETIQEHKKKAQLLLAGNMKKDAMKGGFLEMSRKFSRQKIMSSAEVGVFPIRYYVAISIGNAFGIPLGHHSASQIYAVNDNTGVIVNNFVRCNHGRCPTDNGMAFKCMHAGAATILDTAPQPPHWDCATPYWPVYCFNVFGPSHNCNANAQYQINVSDNPGAPPANNAGICTAPCPRTSPNC